VQEFDAMLCWFNNSPARERAKYTIMHNSNEQKAMIKEVVYKIDINTYAREEENKDLKMNDIARISIRTTRPLMVDEYRDNRDRFRNLMLCFAGSIIVLPVSVQNILLCIIPTSKRP